MKQTKQELELEIRKEIKDVNKALNTLLTIGFESRYISISRIRQIFEGGNRKEKLQEYVEDLENDLVLFLKNYNG